MPCVDPALSQETITTIIFSQESNASKLLMVSQRLCVQLSDCVYSSNTQSSDGTRRVAGVICHGQMDSISEHCHTLHVYLHIYIWKQKTKKHCYSRLKEKKEISAETNSALHAGD